MADGRNSGLAHGTSGSPQLTLENQEVAFISELTQELIENRYINSVDKIILYITEKPDYNITVDLSFFRCVFGNTNAEIFDCKGFSFDYINSERVFGHNEYTIINPDEYYIDLLKYKSMISTFEEYSDCYYTMLSLFKYAIKNNYKINSHIS